MGALLIVLVGGLVAVGLWAWLAPRAGQRRAAPRRAPASPLRLRSAQEIEETRAALEDEDLAQLLAATNARRRARGERERTREDVERELRAREGRVR